MNHEQKKALKAKIKALRAKAETGEQWAEICDLAILLDQVN